MFFVVFSSSFSNPSSYDGKIILSVKVLCVYPMLYIACRRAAPVYHLYICKLI